MTPISALERTARELMAKAAIEIPDDYLAGLRRCADTEKGDLSAFVIQAMLENYEAAKEDRRAMCGDTGLPRWYVKIGNEAQIEGGPVALERIGCEARYLQTRPNTLVSFAAQKRNTACILSSEPSSAMAFCTSTAVMPRSRKRSATTTAVTLASVGAIM